MEDIYNHEPWARTAPACPRAALVEAAGKLSKGDREKLQALEDAFSGHQRDVEKLVPAVFDAEIVRISESNLAPEKQIEAIALVHNRRAAAPQMLEIHDGKQRELIREMSPTAAKLLRDCAKKVAATIAELEKPTRVAELWGLANEGDNDWIEFPLRRLASIIERKIQILDKGQDVDRWWIARHTLSEAGVITPGAKINVMF